MNKILRNLALAAVVATPCVAMAEIAGSGTADDPYVIASAEDLCNAYTKMVDGQMIYFVQTADIDMTGVTDYIPVFGGADSKYNRPMNYDGQNHVIKNFAPTTGKDFTTGDLHDYGQSIFGVFSGELKNLGIVDVNLDVTSGRGGAISGYFGQNSAGIDVTKATNVYVTGTVNGGNANYTGGLFGTTGTAVELNNCFVNVTMKGTDGGKNGLLAGRLNNPATINNCYVAGAASGNAMLVCGQNSVASTLNGFVMFATGEKGTGLSADTGVTFANTATTEAAGLTEVKSWAAYSSTEEVDGYPALNYALSGAGTEEDPYLIASAQDLEAMWTYTGTHNNDVFYFKQTADIDMGDVLEHHAALGFDGNYTNIATIHYDGDNHIISNFMPSNVGSTHVADNITAKDYYAGSLFGVFTGSIKNLGVVDVMSAGQSSIGAGVLGAYGSYCGSSSVENVFVTGSFDGGANYGGGFFGTMAANENYFVSIDKCYINMELTGTSYLGGFMGRVDGPVYIDNSYTAGTVQAGNNAGLVLGADRGKATAKAEVYDVIAFNTGAAKAIACPMTSDSEEVTVATEADKAELIETVQGWSGYQEGLYKGYPALEWQDTTTGIRDIIVNDAVEAEGPAVYYNLQGVQIANPENGIYIVRRGNKVTKELVK